MEILIADNCPICGGPRGEARRANFCEDGEWYDVDVWTNPCGHVDHYKVCIAEARALAEAPKGLLLDMTPQDKALAGMTMGAIFGISEAALKISPESIALALKLHSEIGKYDIVGPAKDVPELSGRIVRAFAEWHAAIQKLMPSIKEIGDRPPLGDDDLKTMEGENRG